MSEASEERCETCRFWRHIGQNPGTDVVAGDCRRRSPLPVWQEPNPKSDQYAGTWWPETDADDWCGEWQAKRVPLSVVPQEAK